LLLALAAAMPEAGRVLITDPGYPCYRNFVRVLGGTPESIDIRSTGYRLTAATLMSAWANGVSGLIFASPSNPTGTVTGAGDMAELLACIDERQGFCISDEIYHGLEYDQPCPTALAASRRAFVINSFSKYFGMTGWRLGWAVVPEGHEEIAERLAQNLFISAPTLSQVAALAAFEAANIDELERRRREFQARRDYLYGALASLGFALPAPPSGAFYIYADCSAFTDDSHRFCLDLLEQAHVAITPGKDFGDRESERYVRFAYTRPVDQLAEGVERIRRFVGR
jgi:aspartate/methionine/tyrosine aminotransferase